MLGGWLLLRRAPSALATSICTIPRCGWDIYCCLIAGKIKGLWCIDLSASLLHIALLAPPTGGRRTAFVALQRYAEGESILVSKLTLEQLNCTGDPAIPQPCPFSPFFLLPCWLLPRVPAPDKLHGICTQHRPRASHLRTACLLTHFHNPTPASSSDKPGGGGGGGGQPGGVFSCLSLYIRK